MKELKDTVDGMLSTDYKERFVAEYQQTKIRYEKLKAFCNCVEAAAMAGTEQPKHDCPLELLPDTAEIYGAVSGTAGTAGCDRGCGAGDLKGDRV